MAEPVSAEQKSVADSPRPQTAERRSHLLRHELVEHRMRGPQPVQRAKGVHPVQQRQDVKIHRSGQRHGALERRGDAQARYPALLGGRPVGPRPVQAPTNRTGLPDKLKTGVEALSGLSLNGVRVHYNSPKPAQLSARAFAQGTNIHVAPGQERYLPHEAWHVVQQAQGRVKATMQMARGIIVNNDPALEHEADLMGARALTSKSVDRVFPLAQVKSLATIQANGLGKLFGFLMNMFKKPTQSFPRLTAGSGRNQLDPLPKYKQNHKFAGYDIAGDFNAVPNGTSEIDIRYMEKTPASTGFKNLFAEGEAAAMEVGSTGIKFTFDQCKPQVLERLDNHAPAAGFELIDEIEDPDTNGPGPTRVYSKALKGKKE